MKNKLFSFKLAYNRAWTRQPFIALHVRVVYGEASFCSVLTRVQKKEWQPLKISKVELDVSHLLFVDDVILFSKYTMDQGRVIRNTYSY